MIQSARDSPYPSERHIKTFHGSPPGGRRRPLSPEEALISSRRIGNIVGDEARITLNDKEFNDYSSRQVDRNTDITGGPIDNRFDRFTPSVDRLDLGLEGSVGEAGQNFMRDVFGVKKALFNAGGYEFAPGVEPVLAPNDRFKKAIRDFQAGNELKVDGRILPGGPSIHMLGLKALGQEDGKPSGYDAAAFKQNTGRDPNRTLSGKPIFADAVPIAAAPNSELRDPVPRPDPEPIETEKPAAKPAVPKLEPTPPFVQGGDKEPPLKKPTKRELLEALMENGRSTAKAMKIDPKLLMGPDLRTYTLIMGIYSYRHLDKRGQRAVNAELEKLRKVDTPLYTKLTMMRADILIQPAWRIWSLTDGELRESISRNRKMGNMLSVFSSVPGEVSAAIAPALVGAGVKIAIGGVALPILIELVAYSMRQQAEKMKDEVERRRLLR